MKKLKHLVEYRALQMLFAAFRAMPLGMASFVGGFLARAIGPYLSAHKTARQNLAMVFPEMKVGEQRKILMAMWDNLGRVAGELPHIPELEFHKYTDISGLENFPKNGKPAIFFSGHIGNWEICYPIARQKGLPLSLIYRQPNNLYVDKLIADIRATQADDQFAKGVKGTIRMLRAIKKGHTLAMLVDQKMNDGIKVPFFGRDAMTAPAIAELALRYDLPLIPARVIRIKGCHYKAVVYPALKIQKTGDHEKDVLAIMTQINALLESWIREYPAQWFWVHKRWPKDVV